jgi:arsenate reductase
VEVWFNPSCSKCRSARDRLEDAGVEYTLRRYLDDPPSEAELRTALTALGLEPWDITRLSEPLARELGVKDMARDADAWIRLLAEHPKLIQRPLVLTDDGRAWVARDDETLTEVVAAGRSTMNDGA